MKNLLLLFISLIAINASSQAVRKKNVQIDFGAGLGVYHAYDNLWGQLAGPKVNAAATLYNFNVSYAVIDQFSLGAELQTQTFLTDNGDTSSHVEAGSGGSLLIRSDYFFLKKGSFTIFSGMGIGAGGLNYSRTETDSLGNVTTGKVHGEGTRISPRAGMKFFFGKKKHFGLFLDYSFNAYTYNIKLFSINDVEQERMSYRQTDDVILTVRGHEVRFGLSIKF